MMRRDFSATPTHDGVFGPEIILDSMTGHCCFKSDDGKLVGNVPERPTTNAFVVWLGHPVIVVSEGVQHANLPTVAAGLRNLLQDRTLPVVVSLGRRTGEAYVRAISDNPTSHLDRELARAEAYVLVQCAWDENEILRVALDDNLFEFRVEYRRESHGQFFPQVE